MKQTKRFEQGKCYMMRSVCDHDCIWVYKVISRTEATVVLQQMRNGKAYGDIARFRINKQRSEMVKAEVVMPTGTYSMAPMLSADNLIMETIKDETYGREFKPEKEFPYGYFVWNIGRHNFPHERCIPLARRGSDEWHVDVNDLRYIMVDTEELALYIIGQAGRKGFVDRTKFNLLIKRFNDKTAK